MALANSSTICIGLKDRLSGRYFSINNPKKPGRPSHCYHTYSMAGTRLVFDVDVVAGNEHTSKHFAPGLWALLDRIPRDLWPALLRGDCGFGNEPIMREAEQRGLAYLFKLRLTANVKRMIERLATQREWTNAGQGWQAKESLLRLDGWSRQRRVIILRRRVKGALTMSSNETLGQQTLSFVEVGADADVYEYSVLARLCRSVRSSSCASSKFSLYLRATAFMESSSVWLYTASYPPSIDSAMPTYIRKRTNTPRSACVRLLKSWGHPSSSSASSSALGMTCFPTPLPGS